MHGEVTSLMYRPVAGKLSVESWRAQWPASTDQSPAFPLWPSSPWTREILTRMGVQCSSWLRDQHHNTMGLPGIACSAVWSTAHGPLPSFAYYAREG
jgi:hypothetical protein